MRVVKIGFIGAGNIARLHTQRLLKIPEAKIVAYADIVKSKAENLASMCSANAYDNWREMLQKEDLDAVYICIPPFAHEDEVHEAASRGIHIFIEKPIALTREKAWDMVRAAEKAGVVTQVGYVWRFAPGICRARDLVRRGQLGKIGLFAARYLGSMLDVVERLPWWKNRQLSGGHVVEQVTHTYDTLRYILGEVVEVVAFYNRFASFHIEGWDVEDAHVAIMRVEDGALACIYSTACAPAWLQGWLIVGSRGMVEMPDPLTIEIRLRGEDIKKERVEIDPYLEESKEFINAILEGKETRAPIREGAKTLELTLAVRESMDRGGQPIRLRT